MTTPDEKKAHGHRLKTAMAQKHIGNQALADLLGVDVKTISNYRAGRTMPPLDQLVYLEKLLGQYNADGDPVEVAIRQSELEPHRQTRVIGEYQTQLWEQRRPTTA